LACGTPKPERYGSTITAQQWVDAFAGRHARKYILLQRDGSPPPLAEVAALNRNEYVETLKWQIDPGE
jgi:hypothetical protein